eukprot:360184-Chlamydomonas_euryale.AAC.10
MRVGKVWAAQCPFTRRPRGPQRQDHRFTTTNSGASTPHTNGVWAAHTAQGARPGAPDRRRRVADKARRGASADDGLPGWNTSHCRHVRAQVSVRSPHRPHTFFTL